MRNRKKNSEFDEKKWKPIIVGIIVFIVVFVGLTLYQQASGKAHGDMIVTGEEGAATGEDAGADGGPPGSDAMAGGGERADGDVEVTTENAAYTNGSGAEEPQMIFVDVGGAVQLSGLFALPSGSRVADAIEAAGGLTDNAEVKYINRAYALSDGDRLYVPTGQEVRDGTAPPTAGQVTASGGATSALPSEATQGGSGQGGLAQVDAGSGLININTAGSDELQKLSGVGPVTAQKIIDYRTKRGEFKRVEDLMNVSGIGAKTFDKLKDYITV